MRNILLTSLSLAFVFFTSCGPSAEENKKLAYKENITAVLKADANIATYSKHESVTQAAAMRNIDLSQCPPDFSAAYVDHLHAWEDLAKIDRALRKLNSDDNINDLLSQEVLNELLGTNESPLLDAVELDNKLREQRNIVSENISSTWKVVERIAVTYGATLTH